MPFSLKHIPYWSALEIKTNGRNSSKVYAEYVSFMDNIPEKQQPDEYTYLIPEGYLDRWMNQFGWTTTMSQTVQSIKGQEKTIMPNITYKPKHLDSLKLKPYPFQHRGISFLVGEKRGIVGDEMGLGKTIQALGALHELFSEGKIEKALIIVPASLKFQWKDEVEKFTNYNAVVVDGTKKKRQSAYNLFKESENIQICIGGYESIRNDIDIVKDIDVDTIVADEAHRMGNTSTQTYKALSKLKSKYLFCLTGTPMQNRPNEIFALMQWVDKDVLGGVTKFRKKHVVIGEKFGRKWQELGYKNLDDLRQNIAPKLLRRMKLEVAPDLPEMVTSTVRVDMNTAQAKLYKEIQEDLELLQEELKEFYELQTEEDAREGKTSEDEAKILGYMYMMQAVSAHPYLLAIGKSKMAQKYLPLVRKCKSSPKLEELVQVLTPLVERGSKIVIFSKYTSMLELIYERISRDFEQHPYVIHGGVPAEQRQEQVRDFTNLPMRQIMLLSDAGNYGLNLQTADTLINYELQWNPAVMAQRAGRIHRIGSTNKTVDIVNMITNDTIDETIANALERKTELTTGLIEKTAEEKDIMKDLLENLS